MVKLFTYYNTNQPYIVEERINGKRNGIVYILNISGQLINKVAYINFQINYIEYLQNNLPHSLHGPAYMKWFDNLQIYFIEYRQNNRRHNEHGPACISWVDNIQVCYIEYWRNGLRHNLHGPAYINWHVNSIEYCQNGIIHNLHGPACIDWHVNGKIFLKVYHFGKLIQTYKFKL